MLLPAANMLMLLLMTVSVGLVLGVTEPITPNGEYSNKTMPPSPVSAVVVKSSIPGVLSSAALFFRYLSSLFPIPVSLALSSASSVRRGVNSSRMALIMALRVLSGHC